MKVTRGEKSVVRGVDDRLRRLGGMNIDGDMERFGALQNRPEELVVQIAAAVVAVDQAPLKP